MARLPAPLRPLWPYAKRAHLAATPVVGAVTRRLPGTRLPRAAVARLDDAAPVVVVREAHDVVRRPSAGDPPGHPAFAVLTDRVPRAAVAELPGGRVLGPHGVVVTAGGALVAEVSPYFATDRAAQHPVFLSRPGPPVEVPGRLGVLSTRGEANYYHFLLDVLPRLDLVARSGLAPPDRWLVAARAPWQRELLALLGVDPAATVDPAGHVRAEVLVVPTLPDPVMRTPAWVVAWLRERLLPAAAGGQRRRRLYVSRGDRPRTRRVVDEARLLAALAPYGLEVLRPEGLNVVEQVRAFRDAELVVGPHGAGLTGLAFCSPGTRVVELLAPDYVNPCYAHLAAQVPGLEHRYVVGTGPRAPLRERVLPGAGVSSDVRVDPERVRAQVGA